MNQLGEMIADTIGRVGPIGFDQYMLDCLYHPQLGFFTRGGGTSRKDFITSPEVGPLFGALIAHDLDMRWSALDSPDPFMVVEVGAGRGRLASAVLRTKPACSSAMRYVLVETSPALRAAQGENLLIEPAELVFPAVDPNDEGELADVAPGSGPIVASIPDLPPRLSNAVVLCNELWDNLPTRIIRKSDGGWLELMVSVENDRLVPLEVLANDNVVEQANRIYENLPAGAYVPMPSGLIDWLERLGRSITKGFLVSIDYTASTGQLVERQPMQWLRTFVGNNRGENPFVAPGDSDLTYDVPLAAVESAAANAGFEFLGSVPQSLWLAQLGIQEFVEEGKHMWEARSNPGDLVAIEGKSRELEAQALCDPSGLGGHRVMVFRK